MEKTKSKGNFLDRILATFQDYYIVFAIAILVILFSIASPYFMTFYNIRNIFLQTCPVAITGIGAALITMAGGYDMSIGHNLMLSSCVMAWLIKYTGMNTFLAILIALCIGFIVGGINGYICSYVGVPSFIESLAMQLVCFGCSKLITNCTPITGLSDSLIWIGRGMIGGSEYGIPFCVILTFLFLALFLFIMRKTKFGRYVYATGGGREAAYFSGIDVKKISWICYSIGGLMAAIGGVVLVGRLDSGTITNGVSYAFDTTIACTMGGVSMAGGRGNMLQAYLGSLFLTLFFNGMTLLNVNPYYQDVIKGLTLLAAVIIDVVRVKRSVGK